MFHLQILSCQISACKWKLFFLFWNEEWVNGLLRFVVICDVKRKFALINGNSSHLGFRRIMEYITKGLPTTSAKNTINGHGNFLWSNRLSNDTEIAEIGLVNTPPNHYKIKIYSLLLTKKRVHALYTLSLILSRLPLRIRSMRKCYSQNWVKCSPNQKPKNSIWMVRERSIYFQWMKFCQKERELWHRRLNFIKSYLYLNKLDKNSRWFD